MSKLVNQSFLDEHLTVERVVHLWVIIKNWTYRRNVVERKIRWSIKDNSMQKVAEVKEK